MKRISLIIVVLSLVAYLGTAIYQVQPGEQAVVRRFGRVLDEPRPPGLHVGLPWGMDRVDRVAVDERRSIEVGFAPDDPGVPNAVPPGQVLTGDQNLVELRISVYYRVYHEHEQTGAVVDYVLNRDRVEEVMTRAAEAALTATLAGQKVDEVLLGKAKDLEPLLRNRLVSTLAGYRLGVAIESVNLTYRPPAKLDDIYREVNRARTQKETAEAEALGQQKTAISQALEEAIKKRSEADALYRQRLLEATAEAQSFLALLQSSDPQNALLSLYLSHMEQVFSRLQVRTLSNADVDQTIFMPLPE